MNKPSFIALSVAALLLTGCSAPAASGPAETPSPSASATATVSTPPTPRATPTVPSKPAPVTAPSTPAPAVVPAPGPIVVPPEPELEPVVEQPVSVPAPPAPAPFIAEAPQPAAPVEPVIPAVPAVQPHTAWTYPDLAPVYAPPWGPDPIRVERAAGTYWNVVGDGYPAGAEIDITFGKWQTDTDLLDIPTVYADANGRYSVQVHLSAGFPAGTYGFMVWYKPFSEEGKRHAMVDVVAPGTGTTTGQ